MPEFQPTGKYYEDVVPGEELLSPGRTITSADIEMFAEWTGDRASALRTDETGRRCVTPFLLVNLADCLFQRLGCVEGTGYCNLGWTWQFHKPVYEMDTLWVMVRWTGARPSRSLPHVGIMEMELTLLNQHDEAVGSADWAVMVLRREQPQQAVQS